MLRLALAFALVLSTLAAGPAMAQPEDDDEARVHFRLGRAYYDSGRFMEAAREFEQAYALSRRPQLLYNVFIAHRDAGQLGPAIEALEQYLAQVPEAQDRDNLTARLASMRRLHEREVASREGSAGPGRDGATDASGGTTETPPPDETTTPDETTEQRAEGAGGAGPSEDVFEPPSEGSGSLVPWIVVGAGGALAIGGAVTGLMALSAESDLEDTCPMDACDPGFEDTRDRGKTLATVADVLFVAGALTAAGGLALLFLLDDGPAERDPAVSAACAGDGCAASVRLRF